MSAVLSIIVRAGDAGRRLDLFLAGRTQRSRTFCAQAVRQGRVTIDGRVAKAGHVLREGERIVADFPPPVAAAALPETIPISVVYDDADLCVVDKPAGMTTHPAPGNPSGTLVNALLGALGSLPSINGVLRPGIVHRLDKGTSGLLVVAKSDRAMRALCAAIARRDVHREYDAVVWGSPPSSSGTIEAAIGRDPAARTKFTVSDRGRSAVTHYTVKERFRSGELSLLQLRLDTGRTHQIRVHCLAIGLPIVGDPLYGGGRPKLGQTRQMLHAARLRFDHPVTGKPLAFESPWPDDFGSLVARLRSGEVS
jgi:23S rRNA pseudouridine1911/1915/1917 synthase